MSPAASAPDTISTRRSLRMPVVTSTRPSPSGPNTQTDDFFSAGFVVRLPVDRGKWRERTAERSALLRRAKAARRGALAQLRDAVLSSFAALAQADGAVTLLETGLVPQARQSLESNRAGYQVDKVDFLSLIDSQVRVSDSDP